MSNGIGLRPVTIPQDAYGIRPPSPAQLETAADPGRRKDRGDDELREAFRSFVGETFYGQLLGAMRKTVNKPAYMHGGRAEEIFQGQLDQLLSQHMSEATAETFADPMFELFMLRQP